MTVHCVHWRKGKTDIKNFIDMGFNMNSFCAVIYRWFFWTLICRMAAALTRGAQSRGLIVTLKHFAANDQEQGRERLYTWVNEQALREIYLEPFEIGVKEREALGIMSSFNRIGATRAGGNKALLTDLLRDEWGYKGFVVSDYTQNWSGSMEGYFGHAVAIYAGNDTILSPNFMDGWLFPGVRSRLNEYYNNDPAGFGTALRNLTKNLCYMKMHTLAFDPDADSIARQGLERIVAMIQELDASEYTEESWAAVEGAVATAKAVLADGDAAQRSLRACPLRRRQART